MPAKERPVHGPCRGGIMRPFASNKIVIRALAALAFVLAAVCGAPRRRLSQPRRHPGGALSAGRRRRRHGARGGGQAVGRLQAAGDRRQQAGRRRHPRHAAGRPCRARRLYAAAWPHRHDLDQSQPLRPRRLRSAQGFRADRAGRLDAGGADRQSVVSGQIGRRIHRARQESSRARSTSAHRRSAPAAT